MIEMIGKDIYYKVSKENWNDIEKVFHLNKNFINKYDSGIERDKSFILSPTNILKIGSLLKIPTSFILDKIDGYLPAGFKIVGDSKINDETMFKFKVQLAEALYVRGSFREFYQDTPTKHSTIIKEIDFKLSQINKVINYLKLNDQHFQKAPLNSNNKGSKLNLVKKVIEQSGCIVIETTGDTTEINPKKITGFFTHFDKWPVIVLNSKINNASQKIKTLIQLFYYFLKNKENNTEYQIILSNGDSESDDWVNKVLIETELNFKNITKNNQDVKQGMVISPTLINMVGYHYEHCELRPWLVSSYFNITQIEIDDFIEYWYY